MTLCTSQLKLGLVLFLKENFAIYLVDEILLIISDVANAPRHLFFNLKQFVTIYCTSNKILNIPIIPQQNIVLVNFVTYGNFSILR